MSVTNAEGLPSAPRSGEHRYSDSDDAQWVVFLVADGFAHSGCLNW